jgi:FkbM family methyltransferase
MDETLSNRADGFQIGRSLSYAAHLFKAVVKQHHRDLLPVLHKLIPRDAVVFDVGGHAGQFAKLFSRIAKDGRVFTFEPGRYALSILRKAIYINRLDNVRIVPLGLSDKAETITLNVPIKTSGAFGFGLSHFGGADGDRPCHREHVETTTLDLFCAEHGIERLNFIKADIEGWEFRMLAGGIRTLSRFRPAIMLEVSERLSRAGDSMAGLHKFMGEMDYRGYTLAPGNATFAPARPDQEGDIFWLPGTR